MNLFRDVARPVPLADIPKASCNPSTYALFPRTILSRHKVQARVELDHVVLDTEEVLEVYLDDGASGVN